MRWGRIAFWLSLGTLAVLVLALSWLWTADLGVFKPQVERFVTEKTGRELSIDGDFSVDLSRHSTVVAKDVRLANAEWAEVDNMVTIGRLEVRIDLWSLISRPIVVELIDVDDATIHLAAPEDRDPNWELPVQDEAPQEAREDNAGLDILFDQIAIDRVSLVLDSAERNRPLKLDVARLYQSHRDDDFLDLELRAMLDGRRVDVDGEAGTWEALLAGKDFEYDIDTVLDTFELSSRGRIDDITNLLRPEIEFSASGPDIDDLTNLLGLGDEGEGDIELAGSFTPTEGGPLVLEIKGNVGLTDIEATGSIADLQSFDDIHLKASSSGPDLGRILRLAGIHQVRKAPYMLHINAESRGDMFIVNEAKMVFADAEFDASAKIPNFPGIDDAVMRIRIEGPDIERLRFVTGMPGAATGAFSMGFTVDVEDDGVEILELTINTSLGELRADGRVGDPATFLGSRLDFRVTSDSLERTAGAYGIKDLPDYPVEVTGAAEYVEGGIRSLRPLQATVGDVSASIDGLLAFARGVAGSDLAFTIEGPSLYDMVNAFTAADGVPEQPFDLEGDLQIRDDGYRFRSVSGTVGSSAVEIDGVLTRRSGLAGTRINFAAEGPNFEDLAEEVANLEVREGPYELSGRIELQQDHIDFSNIELDRDTGHASLDLKLGLPVSDLRIEADLRARGSDVRTVMAELGPFELKEQPLSIDARGKVEGSYVQFEKFEAVIGEARVQSRGELDFDKSGSSSHLHWSADIPSLARFATMNGAQLNDQGISMSADIATSDGNLTVDNLVARLGDSDVNGHIYIAGGDIPEISVDINSEAIVFAPLLEEQEFEYDPEPEFEDGKLIPDITIPFDVMKRFNASIDIDIKELQRDTLFMKDIELDAHLRDGALEVSNAGFKARSGAMTGRAKLEPADGSGIASLQLITRNFALGMTQTNQDLAMTGDMDLNLHSTGADLRTLLGNANGVFFMNARGGRITGNRFVQAIFGDLLQEILGTINPFRETEPYTDFECIVVPFKLDNGLVVDVPNTFVMTDKIRIVVRSSMNLKTEDMQVGVRTTPRRTISISAGELVNPYVQVVGTLAAPRLAVDETGVLISGGAAVATAGLSVLAKGVWDRMSRSRTPCKDTSEEALEELRGRLPDLAIEGLERIE